MEVLRETEDGFRISETDLQMRGAGDLIGTAQSGLPKFRIADLERQAGLMATAQTDATVTARIEVGVGQTQMAIYAVPRNTTGYIVNYYGDLGKTNAAAVTLRLKTCDIENPTTGAIRTRHERAVSEATNAVHIFGAPHGTPLEVPEKSLVWIDATTTSNNVVVNAGFGMILDSLQV